MALSLQLREAARDLHYALVDLGLPNDGLTNSKARLAIEAALAKLAPEEAGEPSSAPSYAELVELFDLTRGSGPERQLWAYAMQQLLRGRNSAKEDFRTRFLPVSLALDALPRPDAPECKGSDEKTQLAALRIALERIASYLGIPCLSARPESGT